MTVQEQIQQIELEITQLKKEQNDSKEQYEALKVELRTTIDQFNNSTEALKVELRTLIDKFNNSTLKRREQDTSITSRLEVLQQTLNTLKRLSNPEASFEEVMKEEVRTDNQTVNQEHKAEAETTTAKNETIHAYTEQKQEKKNEKPAQQPKKEKVQKEPIFDFEKFVGENLISKLGILILLVGVAIGGHYAIANDLISPAMRIVLGFCVAFVLQGFAFKLKKEYKTFSAILSSGSLSIMYFMTYFAYGFYGLISMPFAFVLMMLITVCTVYSAWWYNLQIIAIIGQVGAYVIPFALSTGKGSIYVLLAYVAIINLGIMAVSIKKYWRILFAFSFVATWGIVLTVFATKSSQFGTVGESVKMLAFVFTFFMLFYATFLANKFFNNRDYEYFDVFFMLSNSFLFYGIGFRLLANPETLAAYHGVFTLCNALVHVGVVTALYKRKMFDDSLRRLIMCLAIMFITLAILVWFTGHWVTMFWILEASILFYVARTKQVVFYERMSYPLFVLAVLSLFTDWGNPNGVDNNCFNGFFCLFHGMREMWDSHQFGEQNKVLTYVNTSFFLMAIGWVLYTDAHYPTAKSDTGKKFTNIFSLGAIVIVTLAIFVHFETPVCTMLWSIETALLYFFAWKKDYTVKAEVAVGILLSISLIGLIATASNHHLATTNATTAIFVLCTGAILYIARLRNCKSIFVDCIVITLILSPIYALVPDFKSILEHYEVALNQSVLLCLLYLGYFAVLYFFAQRFSWNDFQVKLMLFLRVTVVISIIIGFGVLDDFREYSDCTWEDGHFVQTLPVSFYVAHYMLMALLAFSLYLMFVYKKSSFRLLKKITEITEEINNALQNTFAILVALSMLSYELKEICALTCNDDSFKMLLSILWGICALALIYYGLVKNKKYIRIEGIVLLSVTLIKLFFYDLSHFSTISKTIVLVAIGALLLVISFFYQRIAKQQAKLSAENEEQSPNDEVTEETDSKHTT